LIAIHKDRQAKRKQGIAISKPKHVTGTDGTDGTGGTDDLGESYNRSLSSVIPSIEAPIEAPIEASIEAPIEAPITAPITAPIEAPINASEARSNSIIKHDPLFPINPITLREFLARYVVSVKMLFIKFC